MSALLLNEASAVRGCVSYVLCVCASVRRPISFSKHVCLHYGEWRDACARTGGPEGWPVLLSWFERDQSLVHHAAPSSECRAACLRTGLEQLVCVCPCVSLRTLLLPLAAIDEPVNVGEQVE